MVQTIFVGNVPTLVLLALAFRVKSLLTTVLCQSVVRFGDINIAPASSIDPFASMMAPLHDPSSASRGFSAVRVGPPGVAFGAAPAQPTVMRAARVPMAGTLQHLYAPFE